MPGIAEQKEKRCHRQRTDMLPSYATVFVISLYLIRGAYHMAMTAFFISTIPRGNDTKQRPMA